MWQQPASQDWWWWCVEGESRHKKVGLLKIALHAGRSRVIAAERANTQHEILARVSLSKTY